MNDDTREPLQERFFFSDTLPAVDPRHFLIRPRLRHLLARAVQNPLVTVVAGAGYGKSLAVYSYLRDAPFKTVWLHLSKRDNNSWRFWESFVRAVAFLNPDTAAKMAANGFPETKGQFERYMLIPRRDMKADIKYVFVFDDFQQINDKSVLNFLERSITASFRNVSSILISRKEPPINTVSFLSKGLLARITEEELRFTQEEMIDYFRLEDITIPEEAARGLYRDTEGWAFAINLAALALKKEGNGDYGRSFMKLSIFNQIEQEVFSVLSGEMQKYFIEFSLIEQLPLAFLKGLTGGEHLIKELRKIGSFVRYDPYLDAYRLHPLFKEYLTGKQDRLTEEEKRKVHFQAGMWCEKNGQKMDAIAHYQKAGDYDKLTEVVYTLPQAMPEHIIRFLLGIMDQGPEELYRKNSRAAALHTRLLFTLGRLKEAAAEARGIIERFKAAPPSVHTKRMLCGSYLNLGFIGMLNSPFVEDYDFPFFFEKAYSSYHLSGVTLRGGVTIAEVGPYACRVSRANAGELDRYIRAMAAAEPYLVASMNGCNCGMTDLTRAEAAYFTGDTDNAIKFAYQALHQAQKQNQYEIETRCLFYLLRLALAMGKYTKIREFFNLLDAQLEEAAYTNRTLFYDIVMGWFYAHIGQPRTVAPWIMDGAEAPELNFIVRGPEMLVKIKAYLAENRCADALAVIAKQDGSYGLGAFLLGKLELKVLEAVCLFREKKPEAALDALEGAYELAAPNALIMPFIEMGKDMGNLARAVPENRRSAIPRTWLEKIAKNSAAYTKKMIALTQSYREAPAASKNRDLSISLRERKVLIGLSEGLTREEIARNTALSVNTVKGTISVLYNKLGAVNRADAIRIATTQGILPPDRGDTR
jgi:LuxR family maltose regulon positive regulatory protein